MGGDGTEAHFVIALHNTQLRRVRADEIPQKRIIPWITKQAKQQQEAV
ncbi:hypothetical protein V461_00440 [Pantoea ananatis BRT98]|nr:hypothetical protein V461_00440 [Pantoea ananatis BRT98]CCF08167.1 hypothetical protein PANA5342_0774 [Pantoea ananatis LMG 5342]